MTKMQLFVLSLLPAIPAGFLIMNLVMGMTHLGSNVMIWGLWLASLVAALVIIGLSLGILFLYRPAAAGAAKAGSALAATAVLPNDKADKGKAVVEAVQDTDNELNDFDDDQDFSDSDDMVDADEFDDFDDDEDFA